MIIKKRGANSWQRHLYVCRWESVIINYIYKKNRDKFMAKEPIRVQMGEYIRANSKTTKNMARGGTRAVSDPIFSRMHPSIYV
jgi:hypothetical protein